jgi:spore coat protein U domain-containing protein, fimbrial subunit CupE1/2/3/6
MFVKSAPAVCRRKLKLAFASLFLLPLAGTSNASQATSTFNVQMTLAPTCIISSTSTLDFGSQGVLAANIDQTTTLAVQCTNTTPYTIGLNEGTGNGASIAVRKMTSGSNTVNYSLYSDTGRSVVWGNTSSNMVGATGNGASQTYTVYGRVPSQTTPAAGSYTDTITVTVNY